MGDLNRLRMKHRRAGRFDVEKLNEDTGAYLMGKDGYMPAETVEYGEAVIHGRAVKYGENKELEILADVWAFVSENIEREAWKSYTRDDWAELERQHVERSEYTEPDLFDDILVKYERGLFTEDEARAYAKRYRACKYRFCLNVFEPRRRDQRYCSDSDCRRREANAVIRYEKTGTYLPPYVYKDNRYDTNEENYERNEIAQDVEANEEMYRRIKRDRTREAYYYMQVFDKDLIDSEDKRHHIPVSIEENSTAI